MSQLSFRRLSIYICIVLAGILTAIYGSIVPFGFLVVGLSGNAQDTGFMIFTMCAIPIFFLVFISFGWSSISMFLYFLLEWKVCDMISAPARCLNPFSNGGGIVIFAINVLLDIAFLLARYPRCGPVYRRMSDLRRVAHI